ncbi:hypothetical protein RHMOL_Rhmol13G0206700 [Rhododendron molle]|uniref:Uncharacterized protein n=1 Tax=Rhododendron molle TaxID=49168 RepID=A0ACC0L8Q7_RHOML|nr:hypothetical protein RHMOL_Rhmol13G0206700 [Rhododendron molle]
MGATTSPVEVGTRGTVASLVMKEIEYFRGLELESRKPQEHIVGVGEASTSSRRSSSSSSGSSSSSSNFLPSFGFLVMTWRRKKRRGSGGFVPSMCSAVEVEDNSLNGIPGFNYRNLKADVKKYQL